MGESSDGAQLIIWTGGKPDVVEQALGPAFARLDDVPENRCEPITPGMLPDVPPGSTVLAMGKKSLEILGEHKIIPKGRAVPSMRQKPIAGPDGVVYFATNDPFLVRTMDGAASEIRHDVALACRWALTGSVRPVLGDYVMVDQLFDLVVQINDLLGGDEGENYLEVACDTETLGLHPEGPNARIITIQFTVEEGTAQVYKLPQDGKVDDDTRACIEWILTHPRILLSGANWKYDSRWINRHLGILCTNLSKDVLLMGSMVDENRSNSLKTLAWEYTSLGGYDTLDEDGYDKSRMDLIPDEPLTEYAGCDTDVTLRVGRKLKKEFQQSPKMVNLYRKAVLPASMGFEAMEHEGVCVDLPAYADLRSELVDELDRLERGMLDMMPRRLRLKYSDKIKSQLEGGKSPLVPNLLRDYFFTPYGLDLKPKMETATGLASTAKDHLVMFGDVPEAQAFVELLTAHTSAAKTKSTYVDGFLNHLREDGRLHPSYMLFAGSMFGDKDDDAGTVSGRTSCKEPAFQTIPKKTVWAKKIRGCFPAPPGHQIIAFDFSQGELKVVACVAQETNMLSAFNSGLDLHAVTAAKFMGLPLKKFDKLKKKDPFKHTAARTGAKAGNFGLLYGMMAPGFREFARTSYGVILTAQEAEDRRDAFFELYPGLLDYHDRMRRTVKAHKMVESPLGRVRHLPLIDSPDRSSSSKAERQAINSPIQSTLNDLTFFALARCRMIEPRAKWFGMVHDQILAYVEDDVAVEVAHNVKEIMDNLPIKRDLLWDHQLPFTSDGEIGPVMNQLVEM